MKVYGVDIRMFSYRYLNRSTKVERSVHWSG